jgi:hypothetical protein
MASKKKEKKESVKKTATAETTTASATPQTGQQPGNDLSISDLKNISTIIDVASTRGAFRANEMATVGVMFNKLSAFLAKVAPEQKPDGNQQVEQNATESTGAKK